MTVELEQLSSLFTVLIVTVVLLVALVALTLGAMISRGRRIRDLERRVVSLEQSRVADAARELAEIS